MFSKRKIAFDLDNKSYYSGDYQLTLQLAFFNSLNFKYIEKTEKIHTIPKQITSKAIGS